MLPGAPHQSLLEQLEAIRVIRGAASPLDDDKCQEKGVPPPATLKFPFAVLRCLVRGGGMGQRDLCYRGKLNGVCVCECVCMCQPNITTETTRIDIPFERKHNKTHWNMPREELRVILKVNKQRSKEEVLSLFHHSRREGIHWVCMRELWVIPTWESLMVL